MATTQTTKTPSLTRLIVVAVVCGLLAVGLMMWMDNMGRRLTRQKFILLGHADEAFVRAVDIVSYGMSETGRDEDGKDCKIANWKRQVR